MMIRWPGQRALEMRIADLEHRSYTDAITAALLTTASGDTDIKVTATAALEAAAGFVGRSFATSEVRASPLIKAALTPLCLLHLGRSLIQYGEMLLMIRFERGRLRLAPAQSWDVYGDPDPMTWRYRVTLGGASTLETFEDVAAERVVHCQYAFDSREPWRGIGPMTQARLGGRLSAQVAAALSDEASGPRGGILALPVEGDSNASSTMETRLRKAAGEILTVEAGDMESSKGAFPMYKTERFGAHPPQSLIDLHKRASAEVWGACGIPPALFDADSDGTARRESYRQALHATVAPLGRLVAHELSQKLEEPIELTWAELRAGDVVGRARAFKGYIEAGLDPLDAARETGVEITMPVREPSPTSPTAS